MDRDGLAMKSTILAGKVSAEDLSDRSGKFCGYPRSPIFVFIK